MAATATMTRDFGWRADDFELEGTDGKTHRLADLRGPNGTLVAFICNHCPYVKAVIADLVTDAVALAADGVNAVAIMPNDTEAYPADSFDNMKAFARQHGFGFPYLIDRTQAVARGYGAVCTPDFFGFDKDLKLRYRGRMYEMEAGLRPKAGARHELLEAMRQIARTGAAPKEQTPSMGCSIKWRS
ncbi:MAG: thioredoxin family protein [Dongiaceae bacterium]